MNALWGFGESLYLWSLMLLVRGMACIAVAAHAMCDGIQDVSRGHQTDGPGEFVEHDEVVRPRVDHLPHQFEQGRLRSDGDGIGCDVAR